MTPGDRVVVRAGRAAKAKAVVVAVDEVLSPSRDRVLVALIRRPRAGDSWEMVSNLTPDDEA